MKMEIISLGLQNTSGKDVVPTFLRKEQFHKS